jgi:AcrR family transcriptional regulator
MSKYQQKSIETEQKLKKSLLKLLTIHPLEKISVKEIVFEAQVNRSTFYLHYKDMDELIAVIEDEVLAGIEKILKREEKFKDVQSRSNISAMEKEIIAQKKLFKILLKNDPGSFTKKIKNLMRQGYLNFLNQNNITLDDKEIELHVSSNFGVFNDWLNDAGFDIKEYTRFIKEEIEKIISKHKNLSAIPFLYLLSDQILPEIHTTANFLIPFMLVN